MVAARKIGTTDRALKQHIADNRKAARAVVENDMSRCVAWTMDHVQRQIADRNGIAILEPAVWLERVRLHPPTRAVIIELRNPEAIFLLRPFALQPQFFRTHPRLPAMV